MDGQILPLPMIPAGPPPPGVRSNFVDPFNRAPNLIACNVILLVVSAFVVAARILSRTLLTEWRLGWDDCMYSFNDHGLCMTTSANLPKDTIIMAFVCKDFEVSGLQN